MLRGENVMDKIRRILYLPVAVHCALFVAMVVCQFMGVNMSLLILLDWCGVVVSPMLLAICAVAHAIVHEGKVFDYLKDSVLVLGAIGVIRLVLYGVHSYAILPIAAICAGVSFFIFFIWFAVFAFTDNMMKKKPKRK